MLNMHFIQNSSLVFIILLSFNSVSYSQDFTDPAYTVQQNTSYINSKYTDQIQQSIKYSDSIIPQAAKNSISSFDFRDLKLMSSYKTVVSFARRENRKRQSMKENYYNLSDILGLTDRSNQEKLSQSLIYCENAAFNFTVLGRLSSFGIRIHSENDAETIFKIFKDKFPPNSSKITEVCKNKSQNACTSRLLVYRDQYILAQINFDDIDKTFKNGKYVYKYDINFESSYLNELDAAAFRKIMISDKPNVPTKL